MKRATNANHEMQPNKFVVSLALSTLPLSAETMEKLINQYSVQGELYFGDTEPARVNYQIDEFQEFVPVDGFRKIDRPLVLRCLGFGRDRVFGIAFVNSPPLFVDLSKIQIDGRSRKRGVKKKAPPRPEAEISFSRSSPLCFVTSEDVRLVVHSRKLSLLLVARIECARRGKQDDVNHGSI